jgi:hypothetical protein
MLVGKRILLLSPNPWGTMRVSKHHYAEALARRGNAIYFLEPPRGRWRARPSTRATDATDGVAVIEPGAGAPLLARYKAARLYDLMQRSYLHQVLHAIGGPPDVVWCFDSNTYPDLGWFEAPLRIYHPVDFTAGPVAPRVANTADIIFSVAPEILAQFGSVRAPRVLIPHGLADAFARRARARAPELPVRSGPARVGYVGNLFHAGVNHALLHTIVEAHRGAEFHFWSPTTFAESNVSGSAAAEVQESVSAVRTRANVVFHSLTGPDGLVEQLEGMDLLLLCYDVRRDPNGGVNSHKVLEYLSTGRVVVSNRITAYAGMRDLVRMPDGDDHHGLPALFAETLRHLDSFNAPELQRARIAFALDNTYQRQVERIERALAGLVPSAGARRVDVR